MCRGHRYLLLGPIVTIVLLGIGIWHSAYDRRTIGAGVVMLSIVFNAVLWTYLKKNPCLEHEDPHYHD